MSLGGSSTGPRQDRVRAWQPMAELLLTLAMVAVCGTLVWAVVWRQPTGSRATAPPARRAAAPPPLPIAAVSLDGAVLRGSPDATVVLLEFSEFQCPYCGRFARETLPSLDKSFVRSGKVQIAFRHFPLPAHQNALRASIAAECAGVQGQFWAMHDLLFANQQRLDDQAIAGHAKTLRLDVKQFDACRSGPIAEKIHQDEAAGRTLGVTGTPAFLVGVRQRDGLVKVVDRLSGAQPLAQFEAAIAKAAKAVETSQR